MGTPDSGTPQGVRRDPGRRVQVAEDGKFIIRGNVFGEDTNKALESFGLTNAAPAAAAAGQSLPMNDGGAITVQGNGAFEWVSDTEFTHERGRACST